MSFLVHVRRPDGDQDIHVCLPDELEGVYRDLSGGLELPCATADDPLGGRPNVSITLTDGRHVSICNAQGRNPDVSAEQYVAADLSVPAGDTALDGVTVRVELPSAPSWLNPSNCDDHVQLLTLAEQGWLSGDETAAGFSLLTCGLREKAGLPELTIGRVPSALVEPLCALLLAICKQTLTSGRTLAAGQILSWQSGARVTFTDSDEYADCLQVVFLI